MNALEIARLLSEVDRDAAAAERVEAGLLETAAHQRAHVVGVTGAPGAGKSTLVSALVTALRASERRVAVLAVDPSGANGGSILGDRIRMAAHNTDPGVFIRSLATRGRLGGLSRSCPMASRVLDSAGFDPIIVETVGVGQAEVGIAELAETTVVVMSPGMGDYVQAIKSGVLEVADIFVVNKSDMAGADNIRIDLQHRIGRPRDPSRGAPPIVMTVASAGRGIEELLGAIDAHRDHLESSGELARRREGRKFAEARAIALDQFEQHLERAVEEMRSHEPWSSTTHGAARELLDVTAHRILAAANGRDGR